MGNTEIASDAVDSSEIKANAVGASELDNSSVTDANIIGNGTPTGASVPPPWPRLVGASELGNDSVDNAAIATGAVTTTKILDGTVTGDRRTSLAARSRTDNVAADTLQAVDLATGSVGDLELAALSVGSGAIKAGAVTLRQDRNGCG